MNKDNSVNIKGTSTQSRIDYHYKCESLGQFMKQAMGNAPYACDDRLLSRNSDWGEKCLGISFGEGIEMLESGWSEGSKKVSELSAQLGVENLVDQTSTILEPDFSGSILDVGEYINGNPEHFLEYTESEVPKPVIKISVPLGIGGRENATSLVNRGVAMLALIDALELTGVSTEVWVNSYFSGSGYYCLTELKIKASEEPFDIDRLSFVVAHPVFFRRIYFSFVENMNKRIVDDIVPCQEYGTPKTYRSKDYDILPDYSPELFRNKESSLQWIKKHCKSVGVKLSEDVI